MIWTVEFTKKGTPHVHLAVQCSMMLAISIAEAWCNSSTNALIGAQDIQIVSGRDGWLMYLSKHQSKKGQTKLPDGMTWEGGRLYGSRYVDREQQLRIWIDEDETELLQKVATTVSGHSARNLWELAPDLLRHYIGQDTDIADAPVGASEHNDAIAEA